MKKNFGLKINDWCVLKEHPNYCYAKILAFVKVNNVACAECLFSQDLTDTFALKKTFKLRDLKKWKSN